MISSRFAAPPGTAVVSFLSKKLPVRVELWLIRIVEGDAVWVKTINGEKVVVPPDVSAIVPDGEFVPNQLFIAVKVVWMLWMLLPEAAAFPATRLKLTVSECA
jgi:hypothetical protein